MTLGHRFGFFLVFLRECLLRVYISFADLLGVHFMDTSRDILFDSPTFVPSVVYVLVLLQTLMMYIYIVTYI